MQNKITFSVVNYSLTRGERTFYFENYCWQQQY